MLKIPARPRLKKMITIGGLLILALVLLGTITSIKAYNQKISSIKNIPNALFCSMDDAFSSTLRFRIFNNLDCSDYPGKETQPAPVPPLKMFQGGIEACNRFPNLPGCQ